MNNLNKIFGVAVQRDLASQKAIKNGKAVTIEDIFTSDSYCGQLALDEETEMSKMDAQDILQEKLNADYQNDMIADECEVSDPSA